MRAVIITCPGGPEVLELRDVPQPVPGTGEVLVRVRASALNRADLMQRAGNYPAPPGVPADIPGMEFAGEVAALGPGAREWREGDRVFGLIGGGAHAEFVTAHERTLSRVPDNLTFEQAGACPEAFITAHDAMVTQAELRAGERVLVHAVGSGVGLAAIQLARASGATPYGTARTREKLEGARELGLADGFVPAAGASDVGERTRELTGGAGVEVVLDLVGGPYFPASIDALALQGRLMLIGLVAGRQGPVDFGAILRKRLTIRGTVLRARPLEERILVTRAFSAHVVPLLASGAVRPVIDSVFPLQEIAAAHERLESNRTFGKVVVLV